MRHGVLVLLLSVFSSWALADKQVMLVLDASGSMWGQIDGKPKITIARDVVDGMLADWNADSQLGLVTYGHRRKGDCSDIETLIPVSDLDVTAFNQAVANLNPKGKTPMTEAVRQAAAQLKHTENAATVILVSDGEETCHADPCAVAAELEASGVDFTTHVIGFDVTEEQGLNQLQGLASNTGGEFHSARDASGLKEALKTTVQKVEAQPVPEPKVDPTAPVNVKLNAVLVAGGEPVGGNDLRLYREELDEFGQPKRVQVARDYYKETVSFTVPPGDYVAVGYLGNASAESAVTVEPGKPLQHTLVYNAARVKINSVLAAGQEVIPGNDIRVWREEADEFGTPKRVEVARDYYKPEVVFVIPAGTYVAGSYLGSAYTEAPLVVEAGKGQLLQLVYNAARVKLNAVLAEGGQPVTGNDIRVLRQSTDDFGNPKREQVARDYYKQEVIFTIPAGQYIANAYLGSAYTEKPIVVEAGKSLAETLVYNAGRLKMTAAMEEGSAPVSGNDFRVYRQEQDEFGNAKRVQVARDYYKQEVVFTVPAGEYLLEVINGNTKGVSTITVPAGQAVDAQLILNQP